MGGAKKFLYTGPKSRHDVEDVEDTPWNFNSNKNSNISPRGYTHSKVNLDDVWSIQRNVNVSNREQKGDGLNLNANKGYYSRYGGMKDKDEFDSSFGGAISNRSQNKHESVGRSWNTGADSRRPFSYSFGGDLPKARDIESPRQTSNSSFGSYNANPGTGFSTNTNAMGSGTRYSTNRYKSPWS